MRSRAGQMTTKNVSTLMERVFHGEAITIPAGTYTDTVRGNMKVYTVIHKDHITGTEVTAYTNADDAIEAANVLVCDFGTPGEIEEQAVKAPILYSATYNGEGDFVRVEEVELK